jgi:hypothetical protein
LRLKVCLLPVFVLVLAAGCGRAREGPGSPVAGAEAAKADPDPRNLKGWGGLTFGMTQAEAEAALSASKRPILERIQNKKGQPVWRLGPEAIDGIQFEPRAIFRGTPPQLSTVVLNCPEEVATSTQYDRLEALFLKELGPTTSIKHEENAELDLALKDAVWSFPRATVSVTFAGSPKKPGNGLMVSYDDPATLK